MLCNCVNADLDKISDCSWYSPPTRDICIHNACTDMTCPHASGRRKRVQKRRSAPARMPACVYAHPHTHTANIFIGGQAGPRNGRGILLETSCGSRGLGKAHGYGKPTTRVKCDQRSENFMVTRIVARGAWTVYVRPCCPPLSFHQFFTASVQMFSVRSWQC